MSAVEPEESTLHPPAHSLRLSGRTSVVVALNQGRAFEDRHNAVIVDANFARALRRDRIDYLLLNLQYVAPIVPRAQTRVNVNAFGRPPPTKCLNQRRGHARREQCACGSDT